MKPLDKFYTSRDAQRQLITKVVICISQANQWQRTQADDSGW